MEAGGRRMPGNWQHLQHSILGPILFCLCLSDKLITASVCTWWRQCLRTEPSAWGQHFLSLILSDSERVVGESRNINLTSPRLVYDDSKRLAPQQEALPLRLTDRHVKLLTWLLGHWGRIPGSELVTEVVYGSIGTVLQQNNLPLLALVCFVPLFYSLLIIERLASIGV